jgi:RTC4-like domain
MATYESPQKSDAEGGRTGLQHGESPANGPEPVKFRAPPYSQSPDKEECVGQATFRLPGVEVDTYFKDIDGSRPSLSAKMLKATVQEDIPATQLPIYKAYNFDDDSLIDKAQSILQTENSQRPSTSALLPNEDDDEDYQTMTQMAKCPMCGESVDPSDLRAYGHMNTRKQEKFCRSHRRATALKTWDNEEYPIIDWVKLDSRISKYHSFIKELINGADSHFRDRLAETVNAGKDRSLLKSDSNPIPGYYGTRGVRAISENTMRKFTQLLKRRMVVDRLLAARGFAHYVECVIVPEVAVKLIMEDMNCGAERAREIMTTSLEVGELLSEEVRDVVTRRGSEDIFEDSDE